MSKVDAKRAMHEFNLAIAIDPKRACAFAERGLIYADSCDFSRAVRDFDKAEALLPRSPLVWSFRGSGLAVMGDVKRGLACIDKAIAIDPYCPAAYFCKGLVTDQIGQRSTAVAAYQKSLRLAGPETPHQVEIARKRLAALTPQPADKRSFDWVDRWRMEARSVLRRQNAAEAELARSVGRVETAA